MEALGVALEASPKAASSWAAQRVAKALKLPAELSKLCSGWMSAASGGDEGVASSTVASRIGAAQHLLRALAASLPERDALALRSRPFEVVLADSTQIGAATAALVPAALPALAASNWALCRKALPVVCTIASNGQRPELEASALEAVEALVEACPEDEVKAVLDKIRSTFGTQLKRGGAASSDPVLACGAARCWAAVAGALLRRGGFASEVSAFLGALLETLEGDAPVTEFVSVAFQVLLPPSFNDKLSAKPKLPPLALQRLSHVALPQLLTHAKASGDTNSQPGEMKKTPAKSSGDAPRKVAVESAVALLCAMPAQTVREDFAEEIRLFTLAGLRRLDEDAATPEAWARSNLRALSSPCMAAFAAQVLQLLVRELSRGAPWIEDDLNAVVLPLTRIGTKYRVPLVRLGSLQSLFLLVKQSHGHLGPFGKQILACIKQAVDDRCREVRLFAVACTNAWHCRGVSDD
jgi:hypothetical protein